MGRWRRRRRRGVATSQELSGVGGACRTSRPTPLPGIIARFGDYGGGETPVPFPNTEVKPSSADGTVGVTRWESRSLPSTYIKSRRPRGWRDFIFSLGIERFWRQKRALPRQKGHFWRQKGCSAGAAAPGAEALDLASLSGRHVVGSSAHLAHEPLLLHLAPELAERLLELLGILYDYPHDATGYRVGD